MAIFETTQKQYELVRGDNPGPAQSFFRGDSLPVMVSWNVTRGDARTYDWPTVKTVDSDSFVGHIQARTGLALDLPTERQWEYACRAGTISRFNNGGDTEEDLKKLGIYKGNQMPGRMPVRVVGSFLPNAWGLYDMHGNKQEWCLDPYITQKGQPGRVLRGGSFSSGAKDCASSSMTGAFASTAAQGFRLCFSTVQNSDSLL